MKYYNAAKNTGLTLVETVILIGIYTVLSAMVFSAANYLYKTTNIQRAQAEEVDNARRGIARLERDLREMTFSENGTFPVARMEEHIIGFYSDIDKDNNVEYVEYELATSTLYKRTYNPTGTPATYDTSLPDMVETLSFYVQNINQATSTFYYFDNANNALNSTSLLTDVRYIKAQLIVNVNPVQSPGEFMLRVGVAPRNLKDNL